jgi:hypothetical protein
MEKNSCCEKNAPAASAVVPVSKMEFIEDKLRNFQKYLSGFATTPEMVAELNQYSKVEEIVPYLAQLIPVYKMGKMDIIVKGFCDKFNTTDEAFKGKVARYVECFCEVLVAV